MLKNKIVDLIFMVIGTLIVTEISMRRKKK